MPSERLSAYLDTTKKHSFLWCLALVFVGCLAIPSFASASTSTLLFGTSGDTDYPYFTESGPTYVQQEGFDFTPQSSAYACSIGLKLTFNTAGDCSTKNKNLVIKLYQTNGSGNPDTGTLMMTYTAAESFMTNGANPPTSYTFNFPACYLLSKDKRYTVSVGRSYNGNSNCYQGSRRTSNQYSWTNYYYNLGGAWTKDATKEYGFTIYGYGASDFDQPATSTYGFTANTDFGAIGNYFRDVLVYLFVPNEQAVSDFKTQSNTITTKAPISYFTAIATTTAAWTASSTNHFTFEFWWPGHPEAATATIDFTQAYLETPTSVRAFANTGLLSIAWVGFAAYGVWRALTLFG